MEWRTSFFVVAFLLVFISMDAVIAQDKSKTPDNKDASKDNKPHTPVDSNKDASEDKPETPVDNNKDAKEGKPKKPIGKNENAKEDKPKKSSDKDKDAKPKKPDDKDANKEKPKKPDDKDKDAKSKKKSDNKDDKPKKKPDDKDKDAKKDKPKKPAKTEVEEYDMLSALPSGQERGFCKAKGSTCYYQTLVCPPECHLRKPKKNKKQKACFINCGSKCEATCKWRKPKCSGYGSLCYDPRFVGGDGVMFYFHGTKGGNFAVVSDDNLQINAHFIGSRPQGRTRDYTWVQALSVMFDTHTLVLAAKRVSQWDEKVDALTVRWDGQDIIIPTDGEIEWRVMTEEREVVVERTDDTNTVKVTVTGLVEMDVRVTPITEEENRVHNYQLPSGDAFAHLETQFKFINPSDLIEGILGKTYQPGYVSPVSRSVRMPMMGGEDKYQTPSLYSPVCSVCRFQRQSEVPTIGLSKF